MKGMAQKFANIGFWALAPDLYRGRVAQDAREADHLMQGLDWDQAMEDVKEAALYLKQQEKVFKVRVLGFCLGGALTIAAACKVSLIDGGTLKKRMNLS